MYSRTGVAFFREHERKMCEIRRLGNDDQNDQQDDVQNDQQDDDLTTIMNGVIELTENVPVTCERTNPNEFVACFTVPNNDRIVGVKVFGEYRTIEFGNFSETEFVGYIMAPIDEFDDILDKNPDFGEELVYTGTYEKIIDDIVDGICNLMNDIVEDDIVEDDIVEDDTVEDDTVEDDTVPFNPYTDIMEDRYIPAKKSHTYRNFLFSEIPEFVEKIACHNIRNEQTDEYTQYILMSISNIFSWVRESLTGDQFEIFCNGMFKTNSDKATRLYIKLLNPDDGPRLRDMVGILITMKTRLKWGMTTVLAEEPSLESIYDEGLSKFDCSITKANNMLSSSLRAIGEARQATRPQARAQVTRPMQQPPTLNLSKPRLKQVVKCHPNTMICHVAMTPYGPMIQVPNGYRLATIHTMYGVQTVLAPVTR